MLCFPVVRVLAGTDKGEPRSSSSRLGSADAAFKWAKTAYSLILFNHFDRVGYREPCIPSTAQSPRPVEGMSPDRMSCSTAAVDAHEFDRCRREFERSAHRLEAGEGL